MQSITRLKLNYSKIAWSIVWHIIHISFLVLTVLFLSAPAMAILSNLHMNKFLVWVVHLCWLLFNIVHSIFTLFFIHYIDFSELLKQSCLGDINWVKAMHMLIIPGFKLDSSWSDIFFRIISIRNDLETAEFKIDLIPCS